MRNGVYYMWILNDHVHCISSLWHPNNYELVKSNRGSCNGRKSGESDMVEQKRDFFSQLAWKLISKKKKIK